MQDPIWDASLTCTHPDESRDAYQRTNEGNFDDDNKPTFGKEALGAAAGFGAMKVFEDRQRREGTPATPLIALRSLNLYFTGKPVSHGLAKEMLAGLAGLEVDRLAQTKGADFVDREEAKRHAENQARSLYDEQYGGMDQYDPNQSQPHDAFNGMDFDGQEQFHNDNRY